MTLQCLASKHKHLYTIKLLQKLVLCVVYGYLLLDMKCVCRFLLELVKPVLIVHNSVISYHKQLPRFETPQM